MQVGMDTMPKVMGINNNCTAKVRRTGTVKITRELVSPCVSFFFSLFSRSPLSVSKLTMVAIQQQKKSKKCLYISLAVLAVLIVAGAVVGGVVGSNAAKKNNAAVSSGANTNGSGSATPTKTSGSAAGAVVPTVRRSHSLLPFTSSSAANPQLLFRAEHLVVV